MASIDMVRARMGTARMLRALVMATSFFSVWHRCWCRAQQLGTELVGR